MNIAFSTPRCTHVRLVQQSKERIGHFHIHNWENLTRPKKQVGVKGEKCQECIDFWWSHRNKPLLREGEKRQKWGWEPKRLGWRNIFNKQLLNSDELIFQSIRLWRFIFPMGRKRWLWKFMYRNSRWRQYTSQCWILKMILTFVAH